MGKYLIIFIILLCLCAGCAIQFPRITATGEKTALENQIVGSYRMIAEESWMIASLRAELPPDSIQFTEEKRRVLLAFQRQLFNADDILDFKRQAIVGEGKDGLLVIFPSDDYQRNNKYKALVDTVVSQENEDRRLIMQRIIELHPDIDPQDRSKVGEVYARMKQDASYPGTLIQDADGNWQKK